MSSSVFLSAFLLPGLAISNETLPAEPTTNGTFIGPIPIINPFYAQMRKLVQIFSKLTNFKYRLKKCQKSSVHSANMPRRTGYPYDCFSWAQAGECDNNPSFMRDEKYCGIFCSSPFTREVSIFSYENFLEFFGKCKISRKSPKNKSNKRKRYSSRS
jgi:hypothetical protein